MGLDVVTTANLAGSLGLFLFGMKVMSDALMALAGNRMRDIMARLTSNRFKGVLTGLFITGLIQSSSATTLMVVSFVNAGLLQLVEAISVIMGANIGTTLTAWLIAILGFEVQVSDIALPLVVLGVVLYLRESPTLKSWGMFVIGFALLFLGLELMKSFVPALGDNPAVYEFLRRLGGWGLPSTMLFLAVGTLLTLALQSSSATMAITLVAASQGWLPFEAAAAMILGENIGTTITANLAALVANTPARRAAAAHLLFNVIGVIWVLILFTPVLGMIDGLSQRIQGASPVTSPADIPIGLALFHSSFNIANTLLLIGFVNPIAAIVGRLVAAKPQPELAASQPVYLKSEFLKYPQTAIHALLQESRRLYRNAVFEVVSHGMGIHREDILSDEPIDRVVRRSRALFPMDFEKFSETRIQPIYTKVVEYASKIQEQFELEHEQNNHVTLIKHADRDVLDILRNVASFNRDLARYINSDNRAIRGEYDKLRSQIAALFRQIAEMDAKIPAAERDAYLTGIWRSIQEQDNRLIGEIDVLIREEQITPQMGASLISSSAQVRHVCKDLIKVAKRLALVGPSFDELELEFGGLGG